MNFLAGGISSPRSYLDMRTLTTGETLCFLQGHSFTYGIMVPYFMMISILLGSYAFICFRIVNTSGVDMSKQQQQAGDAKKMLVLFFTTGVCWLFLILPMLQVTGFWMDYLFTVMKGAQSIALVIVYGLFIIDG